ncbi:CTP synthase [Candidatus Falkowbacteria bacterium]|nr:CTP synthase [Candidatus Falkowbacteria bacterium]
MFNSSDHKYIFVVGGVMSSVGKGIAAASIGKILQSKGYTVTAMKIDPYINVDAGTMNPTEHGEVFVTDDGDETDQDIGNYERFLDITIGKVNYMTTGRVYLSVIHKERNHEYAGKCVQVVPHVPQEVIRRIKEASDLAKSDFTVIEIGGTVGEYENILFIEALRMMKFENPDNVKTVMVSYLPVPGKVGEMKTKPTQHAVRALNANGVNPDFLIARSEYPLDEVRRQKLALYCNVLKDHVISAPDVETIYDIPVNFEQDDLGNKILASFGMKPAKKDLKEWRELIEKIKTVQQEVKIAVVGKYFESGQFTLADSYISVIEAIKHAAWANNVKPVITWVSAEDFERHPQTLSDLEKFDGVLVPGGFGSRGIEGKIKVIGWCREHNKPYLGLCYGMQLAAIEFARNVAGIADAHTTEIDKDTSNPVVHTMPDQIQKIAHGDMGGTMRLGAYECLITKDSVAHKAYGEQKIFERHRHRYEFNNDYKDVLAKAGLVFSGINPQTQLVEIIELPANKFHVGVQFHPEFKSRPLSPHPLFIEFIRNSLS